MDRQRRSTCSEPGHLLEGLDKGGSTVRVPRRINRGHSDEEVVRTEDLGMRECEREEDGVPRGDIGWRDVDTDRFTASILGDLGDGGESGAPELCEVDLDNAVTRRSQQRGDSRGGTEFNLVPLPVAERKRVTLEAGCACQGKAGGRIHPPREEDDGRTRRRRRHAEIYGVRAKGAAWSNASRGVRLVAASRQSLLFDMQPPTQHRVGDAVPRQHSHELLLVVENRERGAA